MQPNSKEYTYYAFISYKREDEKHAKWLQNKLESYGFPVALRKENPSLPSKIRPIFRDKTDLVGNYPKQEIEEAISESKYLIVICSPLAAQSEWVTAEVQYFIDLGREEYIIPFIIDGIPDSDNPEKECYPEPLRNLNGEKEILGININEMGRDAAAIKVIARMFNLRFDTLWQRHERAKRRRRIAVIAATLLLAFLGFAIGAYMVYLNTRIAAERDRAEKQTKIANQERIKVLTANKALVQAKDSIQLQSGLLAKTNNNLEKSNHRLAEEKDNVLKANWKMMENRARIVAEKANQLIDEGDSYLARLLCLEVLPQNLHNPNKPYVPEVERVFRKSFVNNKGKIHINNSIRLLTICENNIIIGHNNLYLYDKKLLNLNRCLFASRHGIIDIDYNHRIKKLILVADNKISIWDSESWKCLDSIEKRNVRVCKYSQDGKKFIIGRKDGFEVYDSKSMQPILSLNGKEYSMAELCLFSHNDNYLTYVDRTTLNLSIINTKTWQFITPQINYPSTIKSIAFSDDDKYLVTTHGDYINILETKTWDCIKTIKVPTHNISTALLARNNIISGGYDGVIRIWDFDNGNLIDSICNHTKGITILKYDTDLGLISASYDGSVIIHGFKFGYLKNLENTKIGNDSHKNMIYTMKLSPNRKYLASGSYDGEIKIWDMNTLHCIATLKGHTHSIYDLCFSPSEKYLLSSSNEIKIWRIGTWECINTF